MHDYMYISTGVNTGNLGWQDIGLSTKLSKDDRMLIEASNLPNNIRIVTTSKTHNRKTSTEITVLFAILKTYDRKTREVVARAKEVSK